MCDSLVLVLGRRATAEGCRGFPPIRRGGAIPPNHLVAERRWNPLRAIGDQCHSRRCPPAFNRRSATNHSCVIAIRGLKPTATIKCRSATGDDSRWSVRVVALRQRRVWMKKGSGAGATVMERQGRANAEETWIVDGAITATSTVPPQTV